MNLTDPGTLKSLLERHGISATKGLGQHFLCSPRVVEKIEKRFDRFKGLLEIGPGPGVLTGALTSGCERMIALEIDQRMIAALSESAPRAEVLHVDALQADLGALFLKLPQPRGIVSNLPYYITAPLLTRIAEARASYDKAVLMMQKEVGERVNAPPGSRLRGSLSVYMQACFTISKVADVPAGAFLPPPKVDSVVLEFLPRAEQHGEQMFKLIRGGFKQPRKTLSNNLDAFGFRRELVVAVLEQLGLDEKIRPQALTLEEWQGLYELLTSHGTGEEPVD